jgi:hypothetical protein
MIGEASITSCPSPESASTGQQPVFSQALTAAAAHSGGSVIETNRPSDTVMIMCTATSAVGSASSRLAGWLADVFRTRTFSRAACQGPGSGVAWTDTVPVSGSRRRMTRAPACSAGSSLPGTRKSVAEPSLSSRRLPTRTRTSCSTASSQAGSWAEVRRCTWRKRTITSMAVGPVRSKTHSAWALVVSDGSVSAYPGGISTPNCQRLWFLVDDARYGYKM